MPRPAARPIPTPGAAAAIGTRDCDSSAGGGPDERRIGAERERGREEENGGGEWRNGIRNMKEKKRRERERRSECVGLVGVYCLVRTVPDRLVPIIWIGGRGGGGGREEEATVPGGDGLEEEGGGRGRGPGGTPGRRPSAQRVSHGRAGPRSRAKGGKTEMRDRRSPTPKDGEKRGFMR